MKNTNLLREQAYMIVNNIAFKFTSFVGYTDFKTK